MGRSVVIEEGLKSRLDELVAEAPSHGLILAQTNNPQSFWIVGLVPTPPRINEDEEEELDEQQRKEKQRTEPIDEAWLAKHALEVGSMLTGGISVAGVYMFTSIKNDPKKDDALLAELVDMVASNVPAHLLPSPGIDAEASVAVNSTRDIDWIGLSYDWNRRRLVARDYLTNYKGDLDYSTGSITDLKYQVFSSGLHSLRCNYPFDIEIPLITTQPTPQSSSSLSASSSYLQGSDPSLVLKQLRTALDKAGLEILNSLEIIDGIPVVNRSLPLSSLSSVTEHRVDLCHLSLAGSLARRRTREDSLVGKLRFTGTIAGIALAIPGEATAFAVDALKRDIIGSLHSRIELLERELTWKQSFLDMVRQTQGDEEEEIDEEEGEEETSGRRRARRKSRKNPIKQPTEAQETFDIFALHCNKPLRFQTTTWPLPKRVLVPFQPPVQLCDYSFSYEQTSEVVERCHKMLGLSLPTRASSNVGEWLIEVETGPAIGENDLPAMIAVPVKKPQQLLVSADGTTRRRSLSPMMRNSEPEDKVKDDEKNNNNNINRKKTDGMEMGRLNKSGSFSKASSTSTSSSSSSSSSSESSLPNTLLTIVVSVLILLAASFMMLGKQ